MDKLTEYREALAVKTRELQAIFDAKPDLDFTDDERDDIKRRNDELNDLGQKHDEAKSLVATAEANRRRNDELNAPVGGVVFPGGGAKDGGREPERKSLGRLVVESAEYKSQRGQANPRFKLSLPGVDFKTTMSTTAGFAPESLRTGRVVEFAVRRPMLQTLIPEDPTDSAAIVYMEETTFTNSAAPVAEAGTKPESALAYTQRTVPVEVIATWLPVTRQQMDDVAQVEGLINNRLTLMVQLAEESQMLNGNGTSPQLVGFYNKSGVQTQAKGADPTPSAVLKAITKVRVTGFAEPDGVVLHPNDWQDILLLQDANGNYIWGHPAEASVDRIWGKPVIATTAATENTGLVGDFGLYSHVSRRMGVEIDVSDSHSDFFVKNLLAIRAESRLALEIYRPAAFCLITGI